MKKSVMSLNGAELDEWVARAQGWTEQGNYWHTPRGGLVYRAGYTPTTDWKQGGALFSRVGIGAQRVKVGLWAAQGGDGHLACGTTELVAKARAFVVLKFGRTVG